MAETKYVCQGCGTKLTDEKVLRAPNPFDPQDKIYGCPLCKDVNRIVRVCDEPDCWEVATCGNPTPDGYRWTCYKHRPKEGGKDE